MKRIKKRLIDIKLPAGQSGFLWGPRKTGKTYWLNSQFEKQPRIDFLKSEVFAEYASQPSLLRERFENVEGPVLIDEVQMVPSLLNEIHWLIANRGRSFLMTGSSPRKLRRSHANLLGGRAWRYSMHPLVYLETEGFDLERVMTSGLLPPHFLSIDPIQDLRAYVADYLKEEIAMEARTQNIPAFSEFLRIAAITTGELLDYTNVARETGVSAKVVRSYFQILEDTLLGFRIGPWKKSRDRRMVMSEKFYLFDVGVSSYLARRSPKQGTPEFGKAFEQFILMELKAYQAYRNPEMEIRFWRTSSGLEADFILGEMTMAVEVKGSERVHEQSLSGLRAIQEEHKPRHSVAVSLDKQPRKLADGIVVLPWQTFLGKLWAGDFGL
jgi:predicted AAA+ superfamily ATPase